MLSDLMEYLSKDIHKILEFLSVTDPNCEAVILKAALANQFQPWHLTEGWHQRTVRA